ncbi:MAG TPA: DUF3618 domain-containing protein [Actinomycetales bacterium]|jgi:cell division septum initiation protein DivIVA|nr:DUF3618 domain-containing protein [Actinomycetales bacterium]
MGEYTQEQRIADDIAGTRQGLSRDVDALTDRVSPSRVVERRVEKTRRGFGRLKDRVMGSADDATSSMSDAAHGVAGSVAGTAQNVAGSVSDTAHGLADTTSTAASQTVGTVREKAEGNPLAAGLIAFGAGWLISSLLPPSQAETMAAQKVVDKAKEHGQPVVEEAKQVGQEMGQQLKEQATQAAQEVKSSAQNSAERVKQEGQSSTQNVKDDVQSQRESGGSGI